MMSHPRGASRPSWLVAGIAIAVAGLAAKPARACSICGCGDPLLTAADPAAIAGTLRLQLDTEYLRVNAGTEGQPGYTDTLTQWSYRVNAVYRPWRRLSFIVTLPIVDKTMRMAGGGADMLMSHLTGVGDAELAARFALWQSTSLMARRAQELALSAGAMLPTGATDAATIDGSGERVPEDPHAQLGTGGFGPFLGMHYRFEQADVAAFADLAYRWRTTATYFDQSTYRFGNAVLWSVHGQYRPHPRLVADLGLDGRHARPDRAAAVNEAGTPVENTGGTVLAIAPGAYVNPLPGIWLFARAQFPVYTSFYGEQDVGPSVIMGLQYEAL